MSVVRSIHMGCDMVYGLFNKLIVYVLGTH